MSSLSGSRVLCRLGGALHTWQRCLPHADAAPSALEGAVAGGRRGFAAAPDYSDPDIAWVFLGPPGVGKGTYASRASKHFGVAHIATGDLIRHEIKAGTACGKQMQQLVCAGHLVPDELIVQLLHRRLSAGRALGERGFILDGFPRTESQAHLLLRDFDIQLALNMSLREDVLMQKCLGRRMCRHCGKNYNVADIYLPAEGGRPEIRMPPLPPPAECAPHLEVREDDREDVVRARLEVHHRQAAPVEAAFAKAGVLRQFEITAGIPETLPHLLAFLDPFVPRAASDPSLRQAAAAYGRGMAADNGVPSSAGRYAVRIH